MNRRGTFPDEERKQWAEKCPSCNEEFVRYKGGAQCSLGKCAGLDLQNKHEEALPLMVVVALPQYRVNVSVPKDWNIWEEGNMGLSNAFTSPPWLKIPWYTLRIKGSFFDTTCHECGHISAIHAKTGKGYVWFGSSMRKAIRKLVVNEKLENHPKYKDKIDYFKSEWKRSQKWHEEIAWQNEYVRIHETLMGSKYAWYNYYNKSPKSHPSSIEWQDF